MIGKKMLIVLVFLLVGQLLSLWSCGKIKYQQGIEDHKRTTVRLITRANIIDTRACVLAAHVGLMSHVVFTTPLEEEHPQLMVKACIDYLDSWATGVTDEEAATALGEVKLYLDSYSELIDKIIVEEQIVRDLFQASVNGVIMNNPLELSSKVLENQERLEEATEFAKKITNTLTSLL